MTIRREVEDLVGAGPLPSEEASVEEIVVTERLLERISPPVSDEEAQALSKAFGSDNCFGLSWALLHLIETAPGAMTARYPDDSGNMWVRLLNARVRALGL